MPKSAKKSVKSSPKKTGKSISKKTPASALMRSKTIMFTKKALTASPKKSSSANSAKQIKSNTKDWQPGYKKEITIEFPFIDFINLRGSTVVGETLALLHPISLHS